MCSDVFSSDSELFRGVEETKSRGEEEGVVLEGYELSDGVYDDMDEHK